MKEVNIKFELCHDEAIVPYNGRYGDLGYDIYPAFDFDYIEISPYETKLIPTGIKSAISGDYGILFRDRGSLGSKGIAVRAGVLDSNYRGEWFVALQNMNDKPALIAKYPNDFDRKDAIVLDYANAIAQFIVVPAFMLKPEIVDDIDEFESERGSAKLGSSNE